MEIMLDFLDKGNMVNTKINNAKSQYIIHFK